MAKSPPTTPGTKDGSGSSAGSGPKVGSKANAGGVQQSRSAAASSARARLAAELAQKEKRRKRMFIVAIPLAVVIVAVGALVAVKLSGTGSGATAVPSGAAADPVVKGVTSVPESVLNQVGAGTIKQPPTAIQAPALTSGGKPKILYVGAEYCPYCAGERWAMVVALSRFGTFTGLGQTASSAKDVYPSTATLSFHGSSFTSSTIAFTGVEIQDANSQPLDTPSAEDQQIESTYNTSGSIPFVDIGGKYVISGASYDVGVLQGKTHEQIATALSDPTSPIAQAVDGTANVITAAICASTSNAPANVCTSAGVTAGASKLG